MKLYIIITTPDYDLWKEADTWTHEEHEDFELRSKELPPDGKVKVVVIPQFPSQKRLDREWKQEVSAKTTKRVIAVLKGNHADEVYIMAHAGTVDRERIASEPDNRLNVADFRHTDGDSVYETAQKLVRGIEIKDGSFEPDQAIKEEQGQTLAQQLRVIKHRLSHLFLPVGIDLQGWEEARFDKQYECEIKQAHEIKETNGDPPKSLLQQAIGLVYRNVSETGGDSAEALVEEAGLTSSREWAAVRQLLPEEGHQGTDSFKAAQAILASLESGDMSRVKEKIEQENSFQKWFVELGQAMDELCDAMKQTGAKDKAPHRH